MCGEWHFFPDEEGTGLSAKYLCCCGQCRALKGARVVYLFMLAAGALGTLASAAVAVGGGHGKTAEQAAEARAAAVACLAGFIVVTAVAIVGLYGLYRDEPKYVLATFYVFVAAACLAVGLVLACVLFFALGGSAFAAQTMTIHGNWTEFEESKLAKKVEETAFVLTVIVNINVLMFLMLDVWFAMIARAAYNYMKVHRQGPRAQPPSVTVDPPTQSAAAPSAYAPVPQTSAEATAPPPPVQYEDEPPAYDDVVMA